MQNSFINKIKKNENYLFIGGAIVISKVVFLFIPYLTTDVQYNDFNKIYYTAAIVILFGKLGFDFAITRINIRHIKLFGSVLLNTFAITFLVFFISNEKNDYTNYLAVFFYSFFYILANVFLIKNLFEGSYKKYFLYKLFYGIVLLISVFILIKINLEIFLVFPIVGILWFLFIYSFNWYKNKGEGRIVDFYKLGISSFIINAALGFAFIADKYIVNHFFEINVANAYTFGWALTAPILYIGSMIEHSIFTAANKNKRKTVANSILFIVFLVSIYGIMIFLIVSFYPAVIPVSINYSLLKSILLLFLIVYPVYAIIQSPLNGVLFKFISSDSQFKLAKIYPIIFLAFCALLFLLFVIDSNKNYVLLIIINASYLFLLLGIKAFIINKSIAKVG